MDVKIDKNNQWVRMKKWTSLRTFNQEIEIWSHGYLGPIIFDHIMIVDSESYQSCKDSIVLDLK